jgi:hypothetical protein
MFPMIEIPLKETFDLDFNQLNSWIEKHHELDSSSFSRELNQIHTCRQDMRGAGTFDILYVRKRHIWKRFNISLLRPVGTFGLAISHFGGPGEALL